MKEGHFYFLKDEYFKRFNDNFLMKNKETIGGKEHGRPCFYTFKLDSSEIYWMIPISSNISKYEKLYDTKIIKYGICDTIVFGNILGYNKTFLIQNMCPVIGRYVSSEYSDPFLLPIEMTNNFNLSIIMKAKKVLNMQRNGIRVIIPDVLKIEKELLRELRS